MFFYKLEKILEYVSIKTLQVHSLISQYIQVKNCLKLDKYYRYSNCKRHRVKNYTQSGGLTLAELNSPSATCPLPTSPFTSGPGKTLKEGEAPGLRQKEGDWLLVTVVIK